MQIEGRGRSGFRSRRGLLFASWCRRGGGTASVERREPAEPRQLPSITTTMRFRSDCRAMANPEPRPRRSQVSLTTVLTVCSGVMLVVAVVFFLMKTKVALTLALGSALAAVALDHAVQALARRGLRRPWAIVVVIGAATVIVVGLGLLLVPPIAAQGRELAAEMPGLWEKLQRTPWFVRLDARLHLEQQVRDYGSAAVGAVNPLLSAIGGVVTALAGILAFLFLAVFMLVFGRDLASAFVTELRPLTRERYERIAEKIYRSVGGYLGGLLGICAINAILTTTFLFFLRMPFFLPLGILSGASSLVPYAGPLVAGAAITVFTLVTGGAWNALAAAIFFVIYGQLEGNVLAPFIYSRTAHVNPLVTLLAILFLVEFMGIAGAVVAVPLAAAAQVLIAEVAAVRRAQAPRHEPPASLDGAS
jgi:putative heme transporter